MERPVIATRRRTIFRAGPGNLLAPPKKQMVAESQRMTSDTTSDVLHKVAGRYENTYKLQPSDSERFQPHTVEQAMREVLEARLKDVSYNHDASTSLSKELVAEIHRKVKDFQWKRYKLVCHVVIGQNSRQGIQVASRCVWDAKLDNHACVRYNNKTLFAVAQCYGVYYE